MRSLDKINGYLPAPVNNGVSKISDMDPDSDPDQVEFNGQLLEEDDNDQERNREKEELLNYLGLQPADVSDIDITGLFPDRLLDFIQMDKELYIVFRSFFEDVDEQENENHDMNSSDGESSSLQGNKRQAPQQPFGEKKLPAKRARMSSSDDESSRDGDDGPKSNGKQ